MRGGEVGYVMREMVLPVAVVVEAIRMGMEVVDFEALSLPLHVHLKEQVHDQHFHIHTNVNHKIDYDL